MKNPGVFAVSRAAFDHEFFSGQEFSQREAWFWLIGAAVWKPKRVKVVAHWFDLQRGELAFSVRFLAERFGWSKSRVHRFIERLEGEGMIIVCSKSGTGAGQQSGHIPTHISICNYNKYAFDGDKGRDSEQTESGTGAGQERDKEEELNNYKKETTSSDQKEDFRDTPIESPSLASKYAFEGKIVKLNQRNFDLWKRAYSFLDLAAELIARDAYLASDRATDADRKNWFASTAQHLANRNQKAKTAQQPKQIVWRSGTEGIL